MFSSLSKGIIDGVYFLGHNTSPAKRFYVMPYFYKITHKNTAMGIRHFTERMKRTTTFRASVKKGKGKKTEKRKRIKQILGV